MTPKKEAVLIILVLKAIIIILAGAAGWRYGMFTHATTGWVIVYILLCATAAYVVASLAVYFSRERKPQKPTHEKET